MLISQQPNYTRVCTIMGRLRPEMVQGWCVPQQKWQKPPDFQRVTFSTYLAQLLLLLMHAEIAANTWLTRVIGARQEDMKTMARNGAPIYYSLEDTHVIEHP